MVYAPADDPDLILAAFVRRLLGFGFDALGLVQQRDPTDPGFDGTPELILIPDEDIPPVEGKQAGKAICGTALRDVGIRLSRALQRHPDVVVLNRYGSQEAAGTGLLDVL